MSTYGRQEHLLGLWKGNSNVTILIDADGCPVVDLTVQTATKYKVPVLILCDTAHQIQRDGAQTLTLVHNLCNRKSSPIQSIIFC